MCGRAGLCLKTGRFILGIPEGFNWLKLRRASGGIKKSQPAPQMPGATTGTLDLLGVPFPHLDILVRQFCFVIRNIKIIGGIVL